LRISRKNLAGLMIGSSMRLEERRRGRACVSRIVAAIAFLKASLANNI
jgi:hypothetical protein